MKYLRTKQQLNALLAQHPVIILIFVDPNQFMPAKLTLNYFYSHGANKHIDHLLFIWNLVDQEIYDKYAVTAFPQITVLKGQEAVFSSIGYNREKANAAIEILCQESGLGTLSKQLNKGVSQCPNGHEMQSLDVNRQSAYVRGCFECNKCKKLCHFEQGRPTLHCSLCSYDICGTCSYSEVLIK